MGIEKHKVPLVGRYNSAVYICPECGEEMLEDNRHGNVHKHIIGFADSTSGMVAVVECPQCFTKFFFHAYGTTYKIFKEYQNK